MKEGINLGIADNTIVMHSTDNGAETFTLPDGGTTPFRTQVPTRTGPSEIVMLKMSAARLGNHMFHMEGGSSERLVHATVFTTPHSPRLDMPLDIPPGRHCGLHPSTCSAWARTNASCSLSSTSVSNSGRSESDKSPSVLRSMRYCNRSFALGGKRRSLTASTHSNGPETVASITYSPCKKADPALAPNM
jgi:hypothetical protein